MFLVLLPSHFSVLEQRLCLMLPVTHDFHFQCLSGTLELEVRVKPSGTCWHKYEKVDSVTKETICLLPSCGTQPFLGMVDRITQGIQASKVTTAAKKKMQNKYLGS